MRPPRPLHGARWWLRFGAAGGAALVFALTLFSASPVAHGWLHEKGGRAHDTASTPETAGEESGCPVEMFANGVSLPLEAPLAAPIGLFDLRPEARAPDFISLVSPRFLHQPERGPPAMG